MTPPVIILGAGGHGKVVADALLLEGRQILGFVDPDPAVHGLVHLGLKVLGADEVLSEYPTSDIELVNGIGSGRDTSARASLFERLVRRGYAFTGVFHPRATWSQFASFGAGVQLMAGCVVQVGAQIGDNVIINTAASVDHDCRIGPHVHIAPGAVLSGSVSVGAGTHVGTGARVIQGVHIGSGCTIGAGAVVIRDVPDNEIAFGVPAHLKDKK